MLGLAALYWIAPESVRWLLAKGKVEEAAKIAKSIAKQNGKEFPEHIFKNLEMKASNETDATELKATSASVLDIFRSKKMFIRILNMSYQWFSITLCFYGLSFASCQLGFVLSWLKLGQWQQCFWTF